MPLHVERRDAVAVLTSTTPSAATRSATRWSSRSSGPWASCATTSPSARVVVTGAGSAFCSGADLGNLVALTDADGAATPGEVRSIYDGFLVFRDSPLPTIAAVNGPAVARGSTSRSRATSASSTPDARFDTRFVTIGLHPGGGHVWMLERPAGPQTAAAMVAFGERVSGERAVELGLAWRCVDPDALLDTAVAIAGTAPTSVPAR